MKRAFLIAGGTVGGLGAVLAITPPQLGSSGSLAISGGLTGSRTSAVASASSTSSTAASASAAPTVAASASAKPVATKKSSAASTTTATKVAAAPAQTTAAAVAPSATAATTTKSINGTFTGPAVFVQYGNMQVKITVVNGRITDAVAVQNPGQGRNARYTNMALPVLKQQTITAQSANIQGVSGASYTSYGWYKSLQGALADAGL